MIEQHKSIRKNLLRRSLYSKEQLANDPIFNPVRPKKVKNNVLWKPLHRLHKRLSMNDRKTIVYYRYGSITNFEVKMLSVRQVAI